MSDLPEPHGIARSFLDQWLYGIDGQRPQEAREMLRRTVDYDEWDEEALDEITDQMKEFAVSANRLANFAPTSGMSLHDDSFFSLFKAIPELRNERHIKPTHLVNRAVMGEAMDLVAYEKLHNYSVSDEITAALAAIKMEPELEVLMDRLNAEQNAAQRLEEQMQDYLELLDAYEDLLDLIGDDPEDDDIVVSVPGEQPGPGGGTPTDAQGDPQEQKALIEEQMRRLRGEMEATADELDQGIEEAVPEIRAAMTSVFDEAVEDADMRNSAATAWGLDPAGLKELDPDKRIELASKLDSEKFRNIAKLFGRMERFAFGCQAKKVHYVPEEIFDIEQGDNLHRVLSTQLAQLPHPILKIDFLRKYADKKLLQYKLRGTERVAQGGIVYLEDGSGSMAGAREIWAKSVGLCLLRIAKKQKRDFIAVHFGGTGETTEFDFRGDGIHGEVHRRSKGYLSESYPDITMSYIDGVVNFAELFYGGGTDFMTPLSQGLDHLQKEYEHNGAVKGDIVFCTDGICGVHEVWLEQFLAERDRLGFRVWGILIGSDVREPMETICDAGIFKIQDLVSGEELADMFQDL